MAPTKINDDRLLSTRQAAMLLGCGDRYVRRLCQDGRLAAERFGRDWLIRVDALAEFSQTRRPPGRPAGT